MPKSDTTTIELLRSAWRQAPPSRFLDYKEFLVVLCDAVRQQVGSYPYKQYASDLGLTSPNAAYIIAHGYRKMTAEQAHALTHRLKITGTERRFFFKLREYTDSDDEAERTHIFSELVAIKGRTLENDAERQRLQFFRDWQHSAIFELVGLNGFQSDPEWICGRFYRHITPEQAAASLRLLEDLGLIYFDAEIGRHRKAQTTVRPGDETEGLAIAGYHLHAIEMAQSALSQTPEDEREYAAMTLTVSEKAARRLKEDVQLFRRYAVFLSEQGAPPEGGESSDRVVQLNIQLFPVTRSS